MTNFESRVWLAVDGNTEVDLVWEKWSSTSGWQVVSRRRDILAIAMATVPPAASQAQQNQNPAPRSAAARHYAACMALARKDPKAAHESALAWRRKGGGDAAIHCVAVALLRLGQHGQAARMMEELAARMEGTRVALKAGLLSQAANAWLIAGQPQRAENLLTGALQLIPMDVETLLDRSVARAALGKYWEALDDLNA